jgi:heme/copper-type cytochrome/quinol oxidase subunit 3
MDIPFTVKARPDTGLWNAKIAVWLFLASEVMLFGGLFSAYIFLRVGSDTPWPTHVLDIKLGFLNTLILIASSITVLQAWLSLKMRNYSRYVIYMVVTLVLAVVFLCIKLSEYSTKFHHYGVRLQDNSVLEGHLPEGYHVKFSNVKTITLASRAGETGLFGWSLMNPGSDAGFLSYLSDSSKPTVKDAEGKDLTLDASSISSAVAQARKTKKAEVKYTATQPLKFSIPPAKLFSYDGSKALFRDGTIIEGHLEDDTMHLEADKVDLRRMISDSEDNLKHAFDTAMKADALRILGPEWQAAFAKHRDDILHKNGNSKALLADADRMREAFTMSLEMKEGGSGSTPPKTLSVGANKIEAVGGAEEHKAASHKGGAEPEVAIKKGDISFYSNFTPKYHNYYAIYFALTSLHGLHILGGAIVLGYFLLFGRRLYEKDPEHMANRVEVGGLFWHFVDVVWMILFPVLYLM